MKKFGFKLVTFLLVPLLSILLLEVAINQLKDDIYSEESLGSVFEKDVNHYAWIDRVKSDTLVVLSGSSTVKYSLSCSTLNEMSLNKVGYVNIAKETRAPIQTYFILKGMNLSRVSKVYFGLDPWVFTKRHYRQRDKYLYADFSFIQALKFYKEYDRGTFIKRYLSLVKFIWPPIYTNSTTVNFNIPPDYGSETINRAAINFNDFVKDWYQIEKYGWSDLQFIYLSKIAELCYSENIKLILFIPPKRSDFSKFYKEKCEITHKEFVDHLVDLNINVPIFGKFDQLNDLGDFDNFAEAYHLNKRGQEVYSELFYELISQEMVLFSNKYMWLEN